MLYLGIPYTMQYPPVLDREFIPFGIWSEAYRARATQPIAIAIEGNNGRISVRNTVIYGTEEMAEADYRYVERYVKFLLWSIGGFRVSICGCPDIAKQLQKDYAPNGKRFFDFDFFQKLYERNLEIVDLPLEKCPEANESPIPIGGHMDGCRIGFDAGATLLTHLYNGMPDGAYELGGQPITLSEGVARLQDGTLAGSSTNLYRCMCRAMEFGIPECDAIRAATYNPACVLQESHRVGSIAPGMIADFLACSPDYSHKQVYLGGKLLTTE